MTLVFVAPRRDSRSTARNRYALFGFPAQSHPLVPQPHAGRLGTRLEVDGVLSNSGTIDYQGDGNIYVNGATGSISIVNQGTIKKSNGTNGSYLQPPLTAQSGSQLLVQSGPMYVYAVTRPLLSRRYW